MTELALVLAVPLPLDFEDDGDGEGEGEKTNTWLEVHLSRQRPRGRHQLSGFGASRRRCAKRRCDSPAASAETAQFKKRNQVRLRFQGSPYARGTFDGNATLG